MSKLSFKAVIFDLDGVITQTALVHSRAWKEMFDDYLKERSEKYDEAFVEFSHSKDYLTFVDGKPRYDGVKSFLESRGIIIEFGNPSDTIEKETVCGIGNRKNIVFNNILKNDGVTVYPSTVKLMNELIEKGIHVGVASSSKNCESVLGAANLLEKIETRVDGVVSAELGLKGKPQPDIFVTAADNLGVNYDEAVVVEDAVSGVAAGAQGNFGLVIGIARENNRKELWQNGADIVVNDLNEISINTIEDWFQNGLKEDNWSIQYKNFDPKKEKSRESLLTTGNGFFGSRGALEESKASDDHYPGTYVAGLYNRLTSKVGDRDIENEDFVNIPNYLSTSIRIEKDEWLSFEDFKVLDIHRRLDFRTGELTRICYLEDSVGRITKFTSHRISSMQNPQLACIKYLVSPQNYSGHIDIKTQIDANIKNAGVERYRQLNQHHFEVLSCTSEDSYADVRIRTVQSQITLIVKQKVNYFSGSKKQDSNLNSFKESKHAGVYSGKYINGKQEFGFEKLVEINADHQKAIIQSVKHPPLQKNTEFSYQELYKSNKTEWGKIWDQIDIKLIGDRKAQKLLRLHLYHLMITTSPHQVNIDAGIPARGLHGEAYRGHIFWDELFILPFYNMHFPDITKSVLMYRYRRLDEARKYAEQHGYKGAMFPWQSGSDGREETQIIHLNPLTGKWGDDYSSLQRHVSLAIAYNIICYYQQSEDLDFIKNYGMEMLIDISRFWISKAKYNKARQKFDISEVMGPDEFHEKYKDSDVGGLKNNAYTNMMLHWVLYKTIHLWDSYFQDGNASSINTLKLEKSEIEQWNNIKNNLNINISEEGIIEQFEGYFELKEIDWDYYQKKYANVYRMDRILKSEGKSSDDYKVAKQADTLMTFYNLDREEIDGIIGKLGKNLQKNYLNDNLLYYLNRSSHGSTLSRVVHAHLANIIHNKDLSWDLYSQALNSDFNDIQGGTTSEGIHTGVMAGTIMIALNSYAGLNLKSDIIKINPSLPKHWREISFNLTFKGDNFTCRLTNNEINLKFNSLERSSTIINVNETPYAIRHNEWKKIFLK